ncbi:HD-GYP domain-containing protein [Humisphaera borealis]|uniref:HD domain-containing protein n=1 Tax=Humisphaera borealis TaxID=2807512 RepID=A0A7M2X1A3_9BACT|nr:HD domain-containing phosphohydrolase [Humisphaera borealis]QOV91528.1 HD domain-containing protein [Humisphaera borealis]
MPQNVLPHLRIYSLTRLTEARDPETLGHVERVCAYAGILARRLTTHRRFRATVDTAFIRRLTVAAALHDAGKAAIPSRILLKPAPLSDFEAAIMRQHTTLGADAVREMLRDHVDPMFREMAVEIALTHHERWDGTGYPYGLSGEQIPASGRIVALADVYDALTSKRTYKDAFSHELARGVILRDRGSHFDPAVVDAFLASEQAMIDAAIDYAERKRQAA